MKYTSIKEILARFYDNTDENVEQDEYLMYQWIAEASRKINIPVDLETKFIKLPIVNFMAYFPCDYSELIALEINGVRIIHDTSYRQQTTDCSSAYKLNGGRIEFNIKDGEVTLYYYGVILDKDNLPMIPDEEYYKEALYWYLEHKSLYKQLRKGIQVEGLYRNAKNEFEKYASFAKAKYKAPTVDRMQAFTEHWQTLTSLKYQYYQGFQGYGNPSELLIGNPLGAAYNTNSPKHI